MKKNITSITSTCVRASDHAGNDLIRTAPEEYSYTYKGNIDISDIRHRRPGIGFSDNVYFRLNHFCVHTRYIDVHKYYYNGKYDE